MADDVKYCLITFICLGLFFVILIGGIQLSWWNLWDENIRQNLLAEKDKCDNIILKTLQDSDTDFINYERTGEDKNVFEIGSWCYKLRNDFNFVYNYKLKSSYWLRGFAWIFAFIITLIISIMVLCSTLEEEKDERFY